MCDHVLKLSGNFREIPLAKLYKMFTYDRAGNECVVNITANSRSEAFAKFDAKFGEDTMIDFCVESSEQYVP